MSVAFKVLRVEHVGNDEWFFQSLLNEAHLLHLLSEDKSVVNLYDCGYLRSEAVEPTYGEVVNFDHDIASFFGESPKYLDAGWRPYLALELMPASTNAPSLISHGGRARIPRNEALDLCLQYVELLCRIHRQNIMYRDFKLEHVYWDGNHLVVIDWNASAETSASPAILEQPVEVRKFVAAVMYPLFTLQNPLNDGVYQSQERSPNQNEAYLASVSELNWGPQCVAPPMIKDVMSQAITDGGGGYRTTEEFRGALVGSAVELGWPLDGVQTDSPPAKVHAHITAAISQLRLGQQQLEFAKKYLEDALDLTEDEEVTRLYQDLCQYLDERVIP